VSDPIITPAPSPPSAPGIAQPQIEDGTSLPPSVLFTPIMPPPPVGDPVGVPQFPPTGTGTAPVPVPIGPQIGPVVAPAPVPPSLPGVAQPQFAGGGSPTIPTSLFPEFSTTPPAPPIVFANIFNMGAVPPPSTPSQDPPPIVPSPIATIPQLPWPPVGPEPPPPLPVNTVRPTVTGTAEVGMTLTSTTGTWTNATSEVRDWMRDGSPIAGATAATYTLEPLDEGHHIAVNVTATGPGGEASMDSLEVGPVVGPPIEDETDEPAAAMAAPARRAAPARKTRRKR
jgi:hypothetical protein